MKICISCDTQNPDHAVKCSSCGGAVFRYRCENCGTEFSEGVYCPHCGVKVGQQARTCPVCSMKYYTNACPNCGFMPKRRGPESAAAQINRPAPAAPVVRKRKTWLWVLGWIFIFPLPLTLILARKLNMDKKVKIILIAAAWVAYLLIGIAGGAGNSDQAEADRSALQQPTVSSTQALAAVSTEAPTQPPTKAPTQAPTQPPAPAPTQAPTPIVFTSYTDSVAAGSTASVTIQGAPNTDYFIHVYYSTVESDAEGLERKTSDADGYVTWEWTVGSNTTKGEHAIAVSGGGTKARVTFTVN